MEIDRDVVIQVSISVAVVALFVLGLALLSDAYGSTIDVTNESIQGELDGEFTDLSVTDDGEVTGTFVGTFDNDFQGPIEGEIDGEVTNDELTGTFDGTVDGAIKGTTSGTVEGTLDEDAETFHGSYDGSVTGETETELSQEGGLALLGLIASFIVAMPIFGYLIERLRSDDDTS